MNSFGNLFRISIYGESHSEEMGIIIDNLPAGIKILESDFEEDMKRRKGGFKGTTARVESDRVIIKSGVFKDFSTGAPLALAIKNKNTKSKDYKKLKDIPRPSHADFTAQKKYQGFNDYRGGGFFSGRMTALLVIAGVIAKKILKNIKIEAKITEIGGLGYQEFMENYQLDQDSYGGVVKCEISKLPLGLGEPFFDSLESKLSHLIFSIPGVKAIEFGNGIEGSKMRGSEFNDRIMDAAGRTATNNNGGINGGISNGNEIFFRVFFKPTPSISKEQTSYNFKTGKVEEFRIEGRHDPCFVLRTPVVVDACAAIVLADFWLMEKRN